MSTFDYDLFVIGAGSGGVRASRMAAGYGARVGIAEERYLGGTCVNVGCVPKKLFVYAAHCAEEFSNARGFGWSGTRPDFDWVQLRTNKNVEIARLNSVYGNLLRSAGVTVHEGRARLLDAHRLAIRAPDGSEVTVTTNKVLIATGSWPFLPAIRGIEHAVTSNEMFHLETLPERALVIGGGYIACEFAGILNGLGVDTTLVYRGSLFLRGFDDRVRSFVAEELAKKGVKLRFDTDVSELERLDNGALRAHLTHRERGGEAPPGAHELGKLDAELVLYATGRQPLVEGLGLETVGVATNQKGAVIVNDYFQTSVANIHAIGDVIDRVQLTPVAIAEGMALAKTLFGAEPTILDYEMIPTAVFCQPNIGTVGWTEASARERLRDLRIYESVFRPMKHTLTGEEERTLMKLIVDAATDRVVGAHMVGPDAGEIVQGLGVALKAGATKAQFDATLGVHPTTAEEFVTMREAVRN